MYLWKQWRESRIISGVAVLALTLLFLLAVKGSIDIRSTNISADDQYRFGAIFIPLFYVEAALVAFWGWLAGGIGAGKNLGEESGSFLFTRPRRRAWFIWNDWGFAMTQIASIVLLANLIIGFLITRFLTLMHSSSNVQLTAQSKPIPLFMLMLLIGLGALFFAGLIYGLSYFCTVLMRRTSGVMLAAGILVGYAIFRGLMGHYYPTVHLPNLIADLFAFDHRTFNGLSEHLGLSLAARAVLMLLLPLSAQAILDRSEI